MESRDFDGFAVPADDDAEFGAPANAPGQAQSRQARMELKSWLSALAVEETRAAQGPIRTPEWVELWRELCDEREPVIDPDGELALNVRGEARVRRRWNWRQALYIAWMATPRGKRIPKTQGELADMLGLSSPAAFRNWRRHKPEIDERIKAVPRDLLITHLADVYDALVEVASSPDPRSHPDRKLFLEMVGEYTPRAEVKADLALAGPVALLPETDEDDE